MNTTPWNYVPQAYARRALKREMTISLIAIGWCAMDICPNGRS
jgi:hypothetical protein